MPRDGAAERDRWDAEVSGRLRNDLAAFHAIQVERLAAREDVPPGCPGQQGAKCAVPLPGAASRIEWTDILIALVPTSLLLELMIPFGAAAALVLFWNAFGPSFVAALMNPPVP